MIVPRVVQTSAGVGDHYDALDAIYRQLWGEHVHHGLWRTGEESQREAVEALSDLVGEQLGFRFGDALVDIGCGYGATARRFAARGARVTGFTLSAAQLAAAKPKPGVSLRLRDWLRSGLPGHQAAGAYAIESSEHMPDKPAFFREAHRVLRPGARLVVCAWLASEAPTRWQIRHLLEPICREGRLPSMGSESDYRALADAAGFDCTRFEDLSAEVARTWTICLRRLSGAVVTRPALVARALASRDRVFALSLPRLILAYRIGAMRYGLFTFTAR